MPPAEASGPTREWTLWVVAAATVPHVAEELLTGWAAWARPTLGIDVPPARFLAANAVLVLAAFAVAPLGWRRPGISLVLPSLTLVNAVFFHLLPTILQGQIAPGTWTAALLYVPFSSWALAGAVRDGVPPRVVAGALVTGAVLMAAIVLAARAVS